MRTLDIDVSCHRQLRVSAHLEMLTGIKSQCRGQKKISWGLLFRKQFDSENCKWKVCLKMTKMQKMFVPLDHLKLITVIERQFKIDSTASSFHFWHFWRFEGKYYFCCWTLFSISLILLSFVQSKNDLGELKLIK